DLTDALLGLGHGEDLVADLTIRTVEWPLDERVAGQYMLAVYRAGRAADAMAHYRKVRERLVDELGTDPGAALQDLHRQILAADPALAAAPGGTAAEPVVVARQLPAAPPHFIGRDPEFVALTALDDPGPGRTVVITAIAGAGGIGKTWFALHWAHRHLDRFPDGQLFVDLRGFSPDGEPMDPAVAVRGFLDALGVEPGRLPVDPHAQAALFRGLVADRRMLILVDNAADTAQVTPLLPGGKSCTVLVTSRNRLSGLVIRHGARQLALDVLSDVEARALLTARLGAARIAAEAAAVDEIIGLCGGFPLALSIIAGRAHTHRRIPLAEFVIELRDLGLGALVDDDPAASLPTVLSWSHRSLRPEQQTAFGLLGIAPGPDIGLPAAANTIGLSQAQAGQVLDALAAASLLTRDTGGRYRMHDLIRRYAGITADQHLIEESRQAALRRVLDFYLHTAHTADRLLHPHALQIQLDPPTPGTRPHPLSDIPSALDWLTAEHANLLAAQRTAAAHHWHEPVWQLARVLSTFHARRGRRHDDLSVWQAALEATADLPDPAVRILVRRLLGRAHGELGQYGKATRHLNLALAMAERHGERTQQAIAHYQLGRLWALQGDDQRALECTARSLELDRAIGNPVWEADSLNTMGWYTARLGDYDTARAHCQAALALHRRHRNPEGEANTLDSLGWIEHGTGRHHHAVHHYRQALDLFRALGNTDLAADTLDNLGHPYAALGQHQQAHEAWQEALELYKAQHRTQDAQRVQRQLGALDDRDSDQPREPTEPAK
ncbi:ATP-binding protein, partial [Saccharothrix deserti]|uniref:ATP-binding protein n=1 Tax=Saccharothrix deserti TaxID=2593674 RepID=UPI00131E81A6